MNFNLSPLHRFAERLEPFAFAAREGDDAHGARLQAARAELPCPPEPGAEGTLEAVQGCLAEREEAVAERLGDYYAGARARLAVEALRSSHSYEILFAHARLLDALHRFAFEAALDELGLLLRLRLLETERELGFKRALLPRKEEKVERLRAELDAAAPAGGAEAERAGAERAEHAYYSGVAEELAAELAQEREAIEALQAEREALGGAPPEAAQVRRRLVLFARGGYGRAEMSFGSDVDSGYCLDSGGLAPGTVALHRELIVRTERLLQCLGLATAHQYFELDEDLSRFAEPDTLHTIPSILEARTLAGSEAVLEALKGRFRAVLPYERLVRRKRAEFEAQGVPELTRMDLKEDSGGLRSLQIPLWLLGITHNASSYMTTELLQLARRKQMLSLWEVSRILLALEFLYELRNFVGAAEACYYDREARESGFVVPSFQPNRIDDQVARLYLFRKQRFASMDEFDTHRLRLVDEVQRISRLFLERVLDRTLRHRLNGFQLSVHLGRRRITAVNSIDNGGSADMRALFREGRALLTLFGYIAETGYALADELKDALAGVVTGFALPTTAEGRAEQAAQLNALLRAPHAHTALRTLFEINDPLAPGMPTLIGRYVPDYDRSVFLLRRMEGQPVLLHEHVLRSVGCAQEGLEALRGEYPELHELLGPGEVLALKWAAFLHGLGRTGSEGEAPARTAERAAEAMAALGNEDAELEARVRLLIEHHATLAALSRTATYMDRALAQFFELAARSLSNATLLFLVNQAVLRARGERGANDVAALRALFGEAIQMLGVMRGFPVRERSLELINVYFDQKKRDLYAETRFHLLVQKAMAQGLRAAVHDPLAAAGGPGWERLQPAAGELEALQKEMLLGSADPREQSRREDKLIRSLRPHLGAEVVQQLTREEEPLLSWFFSAYPNRYVLASPAAELATQVWKFAEFRTAQVIVDVVTGPQGQAEGLLIYTRGLHRPHSRVAYAMSRYWINIASGKVNRVELDTGEHGYCYYFQISTLQPGERLDPRELELSIASESPPELALPEPTATYDRRGVRVEYQGDDGKGYRVEAAEGAYRRVPAAFLHLRVVLRDEPYLFYKVSRAFDLFDVEIQQSLITTIGNQVMDYFYLRPEDYERLRSSRFEEVFSNLMRSDLVSVAR